MAVSTAHLATGTRAGASPAAAVAVLVLALAAWPRLVALGRAPLDPPEAAQAISAWWTASGATEPLASLDPAPTSALLYGAQSSLFWLTDRGGDGLARFAPALAGLALAALPLLLRAGTPASSLPLGALLAVDPWLVAHSRRGTGTMLAVGAAIGCWLLLRRVAAAAPTAAIEDAARRQWSGWAAGTGLLLASGAAAWDFLPAALAAAAVLVAASPGGAPAAATRPPWGKVVAIAAASAVVGATGGLLHWSGLALVSRSLDAWLRSWVRGAETSAAEAIAADGSAGAVDPSASGLDPVAMVYLAALAALAAWGLARSWRATPPDGAGGSGRQLAAALGLWLLWGAAIQLRPGGGSGDWLALQVPLVLAAALGLEQVLAAASRRSLGAPSRAALAAGALLAVAAAAAGVDGLAGDDPRRTLAPVRRLAADVEAFAELPVAERPRIEVETGTRIDAVLAWYLRGVEPRWVTTAETAAADAAPRIVLAPRTRPRSAPPAESEPRGLYAIGVEGDTLRLVEMRSHAGR